MIIHKHVLSIKIHSRFKFKKNYKKTKKCINYILVKLITHCYLPIILRHLPIN